MRQFKGIWIPRTILENKTLEPIDKILWADIDSFNWDEHTFFKSNALISDDYGVSERTISRSIKRLHDANLIIIKTDGRKRTICPASLDNLSTQPRQYGDPASPICLQNNNNISKQSRKTTYSGKNPNSFEEVEKYFEYFNNKDREALNSASDHPFIFSIGGTITKWDQYGDAVDFAGLERSGWSYSRIHKNHLIYEDDMTAMVDVNFSRYNATDESISTTDVVYMLVKQFDSNHDGFLSLIDTMMILCPRTYTYSRNFRATKRQVQYGRQDVALSYAVEFAVVQVL